MGYHYPSRSSVVVVECKKNADTYFQKLFPSDCCVWRGRTVSKPIALHCCHLLVSVLGDFVLWERFQLSFTGCIEEADVVNA